MDKVGLSAQRNATNRDSVVVALTTITGEQVVNHHHHDNGNANCNVAHSKSESCGVILQLLPPPRLVQVSDHDNKQITALVQQRFPKNMCTACVAQTVCDHQLLL